jgi:hypothetical protein
MKYIKMYEAFQATILSKINKYLKTTGVSDRNKKKFLDDLNTIFGTYGIPIDKIQDSDIIYKSRRELYPIKSTEFDNEFNIWGIKFWFSKDGEYLGKTAIGNYKQSEMSSDEKNLLPEELLKKIRDGYLGDRYKTGNLTPLNKDLDSYSQLETGMEVIAYLYEYVWGYHYGPEDNDVNRWVDPLTAGVIYRSGDRIYIIHENVEAEGNYPGGGDAGQYGDYGWGLADATRVYNDHHFLSIYEPSDKPLDFISNNDTEKVDSDDPDIFNFDLTNDGNVTRFKTKNFNKIKNDADFGIFINLDSILKRGGYENTKEIISKRQTAKSGIIGGPHGLSNEELKEINIKRYADLLITRYGISSEGVDFDKLNISLSNLLTEWFLFDLIGGRNIIFTTVQNFLNVIQNLLLAIKDNRRESVEQCFNTVINYINRLKNAKKEFMKFDSRIHQILEENEKFGNLLLSIKEMGKELVDKLKSTKLDNLYSLEMLKTKYITLSNHFRSSYGGDIQKMCRLITNFLHTDIDYTENWDGLTGINFDKCQDIVKSIRVIL